MGESLIEQGLRSAIGDALRAVAPDAVDGAFRLGPEHLERLPAPARASLEPYAGWSVFVFAIPITDEGQWVWHDHGRHRSLMVNYVIAKASTEIVRAAAATGATVVDLPGLTHDGPGVEADLDAQTRDQRVSMTELAELAGLGARGWNNLLLHPVHGPWLQIHAMLVDREMPYVSGVAEDPCTQCGDCIAACPVDALDPEGFDSERCVRVVAAPWSPRSRARALTATTYLECCECLVSCPIGSRPEGILQWQQ